MRLGIQRTGRRRTSESSPKLFPINSEIFLAHAAEPSELPSSLELDLPFACHPAEAKRSALILTLLERQPLPQDSNPAPAKALKRDRFAGAGPFCIH